MSLVSHQPPEFQAGLDDRSGQLNGRLPGRYTTTFEAQINVHQDIDLSFAIARQPGQIGDYVWIVDRHQHGSFARKLDKAGNWGFPSDFIGDQDIANPEAHQPLGLPEPGAGDSDRAVVHLAQRQFEDTVVLEMWTQLCRPVAEETRHGFQVSLHDVEVHKESGRFNVSSLEPDRIRHCTFS